MKKKKSSSPRTQITRQRQNYYFIMTYLSSLVDRYFNRFVMSNRGPNPYRSEIFFQVSVQKSRNYLHVQHSQVSEQNLLQVTTCWQSKLDKTGRLGYQLKYISNKKVCLTTENNNFLTVSSKEVALLYQTAANLLLCNFRFHSNESQ